MTEPITTSLDDIRAATTEQRLMQRALLDFVSEFARSVVVGRSPAEAIVAIGAWTDLFEKLRRHSR